MATAQNLFRSITVVQTSLQTVETTAMFDATHVDQDMSPVDQFIDNTNKINTIYLPLNSLSREMGTLVLLGYMSAVESYFRAIFRHLVNVDEYSRKLVEPLNVTYGAALNHKPEILAEALLEEYSFSGSYNVKQALKDFAGIKGNRPAEVEKAFLDYQKICEMRHCCVHRFGKLGAKNAIKLGLDSHKDILEKPLSLTMDGLQDVSEVIRNSVKIINNYMFESILLRTFKNRVDDGVIPYQNSWTWDFRRDRNRFSKYYNIFSSNLDTRPSPPLKDVYNSFRDSCK
ncbi:hypothetical protein [Vreelandella sp. V005]|uniref:hypothetical protein n=1 Tax=Vreelandella sp. V005 TaxID=3459608 RepID=UPI004043E8AE